ncbi:hypothetical protein LguiA_008488 [Lonicera macranthoides]
MQHWHRWLAQERGPQFEPGLRSRRQLQQDCPARHRPASGDQGTRVATGQHCRVVMEGGSFQNLVPTFVDKSRVLEVKPLRILALVFQPLPNAPPFACSPSFISFPRGFPPLFPFNQGFEDPSNLNQQQTPMR